jgi:hypothetical protein
MFYVPYGSGRAPSHSLYFTLGIIRSIIGCSEAFRMDGADGIAFGRRSHLNVALFDLMGADAGEVHLYRVDDMMLKFSDYTAK